MTDSGEEITVENPTKDINDFIAVETLKFSVRENADSGEEITVENPTEDVNDFSSVDARTRPGDLTACQITNFFSAPKTTGSAKTSLQEHRSQAADKTSPKELM
ncbi:Hypothetical predicted protein [Mytilus galloprovincialis]|uniref:Uncharacterized protein n=1 Tax=Mytilus galloprovincialis TaxID=29158 RepID=A0A8B6BM59_MYTGA|nr:Hypothetical predicted protein [Mytilus galloprovincialis]